jgi:hypothetical protein
MRTITMITACVASLLLSQDAGAGIGRSWEFRVFLDGRDIGRHEFRLDESDDGSRLTSKANFDVRFLFLSVYAYEHANVEHWRGDCLESIESTTNDNGVRARVRGSRSPTGFAVTAGQDSADLPPCVMTFAYWNPAFLEESRLLNPQTGRYVSARTRAVGPDEVLVGGTPTAATRHRLLAEDAVIDVWYSSDGEWLGLASTVGGGRRLEYRLE